MSAEIVNLRRARKNRARDEARRAGDAAAARHGETRAERDARAGERAIETRKLDGARRETPEGESDPGSA